MDISTKYDLTVSSTTWILTEYLKKYFVVLLFFCFSSVIGQTGHNNDPNNKARSDGSVMRISGNGSSESNWTKTGNTIYNNNPGNVAVNDSVAYSKLNVNGDIKANSTTYKGRTHGAMVTIMFDDGLATMFTVVRPIFNARGVKASFAVPVDWIETSYNGGLRLTWSQVLQLQQEGFEISSHPHGLPPFQSFDETMSESKIITEFEHEINTYKSHGITITTLTWPNHISCRLAREVAARYFKGARGEYGINATNRTIFRTYEVRSMQMDAPYMNLRTIEDSILRAAAEGRWTILHRHQVSTTDADTLGQLIDFIQSIHIPMVTFSQGLDSVGNTISAGDNFMVSERGVRMDSIWGEPAFIGNPKVYGSLTVAPKNPVDGRVPTVLHIVNAGNGAGTGASLTMGIDNYIEATAGLKGYYSAGTEGMVLGFTVAGIEKSTLDEKGNLKVPGSVTSPNLVYNTEIKPQCWVSVDTLQMDLSSKYLLGYSEGFVIDTVVYAMTRRGGSPKVTAIIHYGTDISASGTSVVTEGNMITSYSGATKISSINNNEIKAGNMIWLTFSGLSVKPRSFFVTIVGHRL